MNLLRETNAHDPAPDWTLIGLIPPEEDQPHWIGVYRALVTDEHGHQTQLTWFAPGEVALRPTEAADSSADQTGADESTSETSPSAPSPDQAGPTRPGGTTPAHSVTAGRDRHHFPESTGKNISMAANTEERGQPMLLWRGDDHSVIRTPHAAARPLGPCPPVYFRSLAPYRPNRAERSLRLFPSFGKEEPEETLSQPQPNPPTKP